MPVSCVTIWLLTNLSAAKLLVHRLPHRSVESADVILQTWMVMNGRRVYIRFDRTTGFKGAVIVLADHLGQANADA